MSKMSTLNHLLQDFHAAEQAFVEAYNNLHEFLGQYSEPKAQSSKPETTPPEDIVRLDRKLRTGCETQRDMEFGVQGVRAHIGR